jgi:NADH-quinone oxidoreductase subunit E
MSTFSFPELMKPEAMPDMSEWIKAMPAMPVPPLMVHPVAASVAAGAVGVGIAAQMIGAFAGSLQGAMEISRKYGLPAANLNFDRPAGAVASPESPEAGAVEPAAAKTPASKPRRAAAKKQATGKTEAVVSGLEAAETVTRTPDAAPAEQPAAKQALAPEDYKRPPELTRPEKPDDLKQISGVGPKLEEVLNSLGIWTFAQIAGLTGEEVAWLDDYLQFSGRIERDTWREQAAKLAGTGK